MANTSAIRQQAAHTIYQLSSVLAAQQEKKKEKSLSTKYFGEFSGKQVEENGPLAHK